MTQVAIHGRWFVPLLITAAAMASTPLHAEPGLETFDRGQALYENHCQECHESWAHRREGRRVNSRQELRERVSGWSLHIGLGWSAEEIDDVTDYLNRSFYHFAD